MSVKMNSLAFSILLGGMSSRMGNDKAKLKIESESGESTFLEHLAGEINDFGDKYLSINSSQDYSLEGFTNIIDSFPNIGPLGGIYSVLKASKKQYVLFVACDMPKLTKEAISHLISEWNGEDMCISKTANGRQPLVGIYSKACIPFIKDLIDKKIYRPGMLFDSVKSKLVDMSDFEDCFANINTIDDYKKLTNEKKEN